MTTYQVDASGLTAQLGGCSVQLTDSIKSELAKTIQTLLKEQSTHIDSTLKTTSSKNFKIRITNNPQGSHVFIKPSNNESILLPDVHTQNLVSSMFQKIVQLAPPAPPPQASSATNPPPPQPISPTIQSNPTHLPHAPLSSSPTTAPLRGDSTIEASVTAESSDPSKISTLQNLLQQSAKSLKEITLKFNQVSAHKDDLLLTFLKTKIQNIEEQIKPLKTQLEDSYYLQRWWSPKWYKELTEQIAHLEQQITQLKRPQELRETIQKYTETQEKLRQLPKSSSNQTTMTQDEQQFYIDVTRHKKVLEDSSTLLKNNIALLQEEEDLLMKELLPQCTDTISEASSEIDKLTKKIEHLESRLTSLPIPQSTANQTTIQLEMQLYEKEIERLRYGSEVTRSTLIVKNLFKLLIKEKIQGSEMELQKIQKELDMHDDAAFPVVPCPETPYNVLLNKRLELENHIKDLKAVDDLPTVEQALREETQKLSTCFSSTDSPYPSSTKDKNEQIINKGYLNNRNDLVKRIQDLHNLYLNLSARQEKVLLEINKKGSSTLISSAAVKTPPNLKQLSTTYATPSPITPSPITPSPITPSPITKASITKASRASEELEAFFTPIRATSPDAADDDDYLR